MVGNVTLSLSSDVGCSDALNTSKQRPSESSVADAEATLNGARTQTKRSQRQYQDDTSQRLDIHIKFSPFLPVRDLTEDRLNH